MVRSATSVAAPESVRIVLTGHVQGVGFRPFVYRIAVENNLTGEVLNKVGEVEIIATGERESVEKFTTELIDKAPPLSRPVLESVEFIDAQKFAAFSIVASAENADAKIFVPPDYFMCDDCRQELHDPDDRRYRYPFINCTQCGPRYTLIRRLPYDRENTSMAAFPLCDACRLEYEDPSDRRFHAEPVACPDCGPQIAFAESGGHATVEGEDALQQALVVLRSGRIVAVKGVGGYHLMCDASNDEAVSRLRERKHRPDKPLAVMFPVEGDDSLAAIRKAVDVPVDVAELLAGPMRPIVLATKKDQSLLADSIAPRLSEFGVFLPYAPLHQLLLADFGGPLVATSGNLSGEPVLTDADEASRRLADIADAFLHHDRPILRPADDPVFRRIGGKPRPLRIGRGASPREIALPWRLDEPVLAVGGHMKGTVAIGWDERAVVSPHIGEMDSPRSMSVFEAVAADLQELYGVSATRVACDAHPGYATHRWAMNCGLPVETVWHHFAHASALVAEDPAEGDWLVFAWDGVGLGPDGTLWGGEALHGRPGRWRRVASMRPFRLPGGERAGRQPWRSAAALHWECGLDFENNPDTDNLAKAAWRQHLNAPQTTAVGRLFDAASAVVCGAQRVSFEAQGPMQLESLCKSDGEVVRLEQYVDDDGIVRTDWAALLHMLADRKLSAAARAESFHSSMAWALYEQVRHIAVANDFQRVGLTGGVFQNRVLTDQVMRLLEGDGYDVATSETLPCNDAAISFGQLAECAAISTIEAE
ncbi:MAG: carbamoyltransferase HypF [Gammaproteobacteria bacterium]|nr:carbamoyltransferase HypF [Gammaproteobacteria bacterium]